MTEYVKNHGAEKQTLPIRAEVKSVAGVMIDGDLLEIDMAGLRMVSNRDLPVGTECTVTLVLEDRPDFMRVPICGEISDADDVGMAIAFRENDPDRMEHLQEVVSYSHAAGKR